MITDLEQIFPNAALDLLSSSVDVLGVDAPALAMIITGAPVAPMGDGECAGLLTVGWGPAYPSKVPLARDPTGQQQCQVITVIQLVQTLWVCTPTFDDTGNIDPAKITAAAVDLTRIASKWWFGLLGLGVQGTFPDLDLPACGAINWGQLAAGSNSGGVQALTWTLTLSIS